MTQPIGPLALEGLNTSNSQPIANSTADNGHGTTLVPPRVPNETLWTSYGIDKNMLFMKYDNVTMGEDTHREEAMSFLNDNLERFFN